MLHRDFVGFLRYDSLESEICVRSNFQLKYYDWKST